MEKEDKEFREGEYEGEKEDVRVVGRKERER